MLLHFSRDGGVLLVASTFGLAVYDVRTGIRLYHDAALSSALITAWEEETETLITLGADPKTENTFSHASLAHSGPVDMTDGGERDAAGFFPTPPAHRVCVVYRFMSTASVTSHLTTESPVSQLLVNAALLLLRVGDAVCLYARSSLLPVATLEANGPLDSPAVSLPVCLSALRVWRGVGKTAFDNHAASKEDRRVSTVAIPFQPKPTKGYDVMLLSVPSGASAVLSSSVIPVVPLGGMTFAPNGTLLAIASRRGTVIRLFRAPEGVPLRAFRRGHTAVNMRGLFFAEDATLLATLSNASTLHVFATSGETETALTAAAETEERSVVKLSLSSPPEDGSVVAFMTESANANHTYPTLCLASMSRKGVVLQCFKAVDAKYECCAEHVLA